MNAIPLPTQFLYEFSIDPAIVDKSLEYFLSLDLQSRPSLLDVPNSMEGVGLNQVLDLGGKSESVTCLYHKELFDELQKCVDQVAEKHFKTTKLAICDSWLTRSKFGQASGVHFHQCSVFSGLLYMTDQERSETLFYLHDPFYMRNQHLFGLSMNEIPYKYTVKPVKGKLLLWDSSIDHRVGPLTEKNIRYTFAFNTWPTGMISNLFTGKLTSNVVDVEQLSQKS